MNFFIYLFFIILFTVSILLNRYNACTIFLISIRTFFSFRNIVYICDIFTNLNICIYFWYSIWTLLSSLVWSRLVGESSSSHLIQVNNSHVYLNIIDIELLSLFVNGTIHSDHAWTIKIKSGSITSLQIGIHVYARISCWTVLN